MNAYEIMAELKRLQTLGRQTPNGLTMKEMPKSGGTITVSNVGAVGKGGKSSLAYTLIAPQWLIPITFSEWASPLLVPGGGVAIVAIGRAKWVTRENDLGMSERRLEVGVSWGADHRVVEGTQRSSFRSLQTAV